MPDNTPLPGVEYLRRHHDEFVSLYHETGSYSRKNDKQVAKILNERIKLLHQGQYMPVSRAIVQNYRSQNRLVQGPHLTKHQQGVRYLQGNLTVLVCLLLSSNQITSDTDVEIAHLLDAECNVAHITPSVVRSVRLDHGIDGRKAYWYQSSDLSQSVHDVLSEMGIAGTLDAIEMPKRSEYAEECLRLLTTFTVSPSPQPQETPDEPTTQETQPQNVSEDPAESQQIRQQELDSLVPEVNKELDKVPNRQWKARWKPAKRLQPSPPVPSVEEVRVKRAFRNAKTVLKRSQREPSELAAGLYEAVAQMTPQEINNLNLHRLRELTTPGDTITVFMGPKKQYQVDIQISDGQPVLGNVRIGLREFEQLLQHAPA